MIKAGVVSTREPRFGVPLPATHASGLARFVATSEEAGVERVTVTDHFSGSSSGDPFMNLAAAAMASSALRLQPTMICSDLRPPVQVFHSARTLQVISRGRLDLGLGAGWLAEDYAALGQTMDPASVRIERLTEAVELLSRLWVGGDIDHAGRHYRVRVDGVPHADALVQRPPMVLGGGGPRMLALAAEHADILHFNAMLAGGRWDASADADLAIPELDRKVADARRVAVETGRASALELELTIFEAYQATTRHQHRRLVSELATRWNVDPGAVPDLPHVLTGSFADWTDQIGRRQERWGIDIFIVPATEAVLEFVRTHGSQ